MAEPLLLTNARLSDRDAPVDVVLADGAIAAIIPAGGRRQRPEPEHQVDLDGRFLLPGLWDEHVHFTQWALTRQRLDVSGARSAAAAAGLVRQRIAAGGPPPGAPLVGYGFRDGLWADLPTAAMLDDAGSGAPVVLVSADLHCLWLGTAAAQQLGVSIDATGVLREDAAFAVTQQLAEVPEQLLDAWVADAAMAAAARGVVGIVDLEMAWNPGAWTRRVGRGLRALRVDAGIYTEHLDRAIAAGLRTGRPIDGGEGLVCTGPFKILIDGSLNTRTAYCSDPYPGGSHGMLTVPPEDLAELLQRAADAGITPAVHAIGDRANQIALDTFAALGVSGRIEHAQLVTAKDVPRFAEFGIGASVQPQHAMVDREVADRHWPGRTDSAFRLRSFLDAGVQLAFGSDAPVTPLDPWLAIGAAVFRSDDSRPPWHVEQSIPMAAALSCSARGATTLTVGGSADLVCVDIDPLAAGADAVRSMPVALTVVGGVVSFRRL